MCPLCSPARFPADRENLLEVWERSESWEAWETLRRNDPTGVDPTTKYAIHDASGGAR